MSTNLEQCFTEAMEIVALNEILLFCLNSDQQDETDKYQLAILAKIISIKLQNLKHKIDQELIKNAILNK